MNDCTLNQKESTNQNQLFFCDKIISHFRLHQGFDHHLAESDSPMTPNSASCSSQVRTAGAARMRVLHIMAFLGIWRTFGPNTTCQNTVFLHVKSASLHDRFPQTLASFGSKNKCKAWLRKAVHAKAHLSQPFGF